MAFSEADLDLVEDRQAECLNTFDVYTYLGIYIHSIYEYK